MEVSRRVRFAMTAAAACSVACGVAIVAFVAWPLPRALTAPIAEPALTLTDREGVVLRTTRAADGSRARWMPIADIDAKLIAAFVAVEDRRYFSHGAIDWRAVARAAYHDARAGRVVSGASTIAMQTARLLHPTPRTIGGKIAQTLWALRLGVHLSKQEMLEQYLNRIQLGQGAVGVESGAALYFGASAREVSVGQAALLAGLAHAPSADNPLISQRRARARRALALARMKSAGVATESDAVLALEEPVLLEASKQRFLAPHFTTHYLAAKGEDLATDAPIRTSLDYTLENDVELEVRRTVLDLRERGVEHAAAIVLDNHSGEVLAWVGSPDFFADSAGQTDMVISPRQPGSALKPFLYGIAFDRGFTPASILADIPHTYQTSTGPYHPRNYDRRFHGPVRARTALGSSYNVPAIELAQQLGASILLQTLHLAGFTSLRESADYYGLGLALGNGDVTLLELANGYRAIANGGVWRPITMTATTGSARTSGESAERLRESQRVMTPVAAALVLDILADPVARAPGFGIESALEFPFPAAVKTGTSRHFTDNWAVATTAGFTVAVWVGNFNGRPMDGVSGVSGAGPLMHRIVMHTAARYDPGALPSPASAGAVQRDVCQLSGLLVADGCPSLAEWFAPGTAPTAFDDWHRGGGVTLPAEYAEWRSQGGDAMLAAVGDSALTDPSPFVTSRVSARRFRISSPLNGDRYDVPPGVDARFATIALRSEGADARAVRWFVDGQETKASRLSLVAGTHVIRASASASESDEVRVTVDR